MESIDKKKALSRWFAENANWFVVFTRTREEQKIADRLQSKLDGEKYVVFVPTKDYAYTKDKVTTIIQKPWISGYVFIAATVTPKEFLETVKPLFCTETNVYKILSNDGQFESIQLSRRDKGIMTKILNENFNIPALEAVLEGDRVRIIDNALAGMNAEVVKVNKKRQTAVLMMEFLERRMECEIALEFVIKD